MATGYFKADRCTIESNPRDGEMESRRRGPADRAYDRGRLLDASDGRGRRERWEGRG